MWVPSPPVPLLVQSRHLQPRSDEDISFPLGYLQLGLTLSSTALVGDNAWRVYPGLIMTVPASANTGSVGLLWYLVASSSSGTGNIHYLSCVVGCWPRIAS